MQGKSHCGAFTPQVQARVHDIRVCEKTMHGRSCLCTTRRTPHGKMQFHCSTLRIHLASTLAALDMILLPVSLYWQYYAGQFHEQNQLLY